MRNILLAVTGLFVFYTASAQNVSLNMLVLNSGVIPTGGTGTLQATINATTGTAGQSNPVVSGKVNVQVTVPPSLNISATQNGLPTGWTVRNNNGTVINICNSSTTLAVNTAEDLLITVEGVTATTGSPAISGQISFRTNCTAPGSLAGNNPADDASQAGFIVAGTVPVEISNFTAVSINCRPVLNWFSETETNLDRFEIEKSNISQQNWETVDMLEAKGNSIAEKNKYRFTDFSLGSNTETFYRLKMIDNDGRYSYSTVVSVLINCNTESVVVFPNPVKNGVINVFVSGINKNATAILISGTGQVLSKTIVKDGNGKISSAGLAKGIYLLKIIFSNGVNKTVKKIIVD
jgi:hypothetical protein